MGVEETCPEAGRRPARAVAVVAMSDMEQPTRLHVESLMEGPLLLVRTRSVGVITMHQPMRIGIASNV
jgi:hypothetical protein